MRRSYSSIQKTDLLKLASIVGKSNLLLPGGDGTERYTTDWLGNNPSPLSSVVRPGDTREVSEVLKYCNFRGIGVVPQAGNTGLVRGGVPSESSQIVLSVERLNSISHIDEESGVVVCGAGVVLQTLDEALKEKGLMAPLDLGAKGSCMIGGNVSTNAGGLRLLRYGSLHGSVLGLEVVLANGTVLNMMTTLRKDNVGFDVKQIFIGGEGALGVITAVSLLAAPRPTTVNVSMLGVRSFENCRRLLRLARQKCGEIISAVEFSDTQALGLAMGAMAGFGPLPFQSPHPFYLFLETSGSHSSHDQEKLMGFLEAAQSAGLLEDGVIAGDVRQARSIWRLREDLPVGIAKRGKVFKYDVSLALPRMYSFVEATRERLSNLGWDAKGVIPVGYGHLGDGNLHLNVSTPLSISMPGGQAFLSALERDIEPWVYEWTLKEGGSISAEHGIGRDKVEWLPRAKPEAVVLAMRGIKELLDPKGIMNPGKVLSS